MQSMRRLKEIFVFRWKGFKYDALHIRTPFCFVFPYTFYFVIGRIHGSEAVISLGQIENYFLEVIKIDRRDSE